MIELTLQSRMMGDLLPREVPNMREWAESHVVIPDGPYKGELFTCDTQPFSGVFLDSVDSGRFGRIVATGPTQTGKTLLCYVVPVLYHLFAIGETVVAGLPSLDMADDKWSQDLLPVIEASPSLRRLLPTTGPGSRSGRVKSRAKFRNAATLRFLSGAGRDKSRAGYTARVLAVTEVDGLEQGTTTSEESGPLRQMEARQRAFLETGIRTYLECTVTTSNGRIWQEYTGGTESRIARPCPHCSEYVTPEREHLKGWQDAENELQARAKATWTCPACSHPWTEQERYQANLQSVLVHRGQEVTSAGQVTGPIPPTRTLGFRWTAVDNHLASAADVAADEWAAQREVDRDNAERELCQFVHCIPCDPPEIELEPLTSDDVLRSAAKLKKGIVPDGCCGVSIGCDTGKRLLHWTAIAWLPSGSGHVVEYGSQTVNSDKLGVKQALITALRALKGYFDRGWQSEDGEIHKPTQAWIDSGWHEHQAGVYEFSGEANSGLREGSEVYRPSKGYGEGQRRMSRYFAPRDSARDVALVGVGYHLSWVKRWQIMLCHLNADHWKSETHQRLAMPDDASLSLSLYATADPIEHQEFADHLTAEQQVERYVDGRGESVCWERIRRANHYLDAAYAAVAAGDLILTLWAQAAENAAQQGAANQIPPPSTPSWEDRPRYYLGETDHARTLTLNDSQGMAGRDHGSDAIR